MLERRFVEVPWTGAVVHLCMDTGALMPLDALAGGVLPLTWPGSQAEGASRRPLDQPGDAVRHPTRAQARVGEPAFARGRAKACRTPADEGLGAGGVTIAADTRLGSWAVPIVELVRVQAEGLAALVAQYTGDAAPQVRIEITTWWGMYRRRLAASMAVAGHPRRRPRLRACAAYLVSALRARRASGLTLPDCAGGSTILLGAHALRRQGPGVRTVLLHQLRHAAQLSWPACRALVIARIRHEMALECRDAAWVADSDAALAEDERDAHEAEGWSWTALLAECDPLGARLGIRPSGIAVRG